MPKKQVPDWKDVPEAARKNIIRSLRGMAKVTDNMRQAWGDQFVPDVMSEHAAASLAAAKVLEDAAKK